MICPKCKKEYKTYSSFCNNCYTKLDPSEFLNKDLHKFKKIQKMISPKKFPKSKGDINFKNVMLNEFDITDKNNYLNNKISIEQLIQNFYKKEGYTVLKCENNYWIILFLITFWNQLFETRDFILTTDNFKNCLNNIPSKNKLKNLNFEKLNKRNRFINHILNSYYEHFDSIHKYIPLSKLHNVNLEKSKFGLGDFFSSEEMLSAPIYFNNEQISLIFKRLCSDFEFYQRGLPDLIIFNENEFFFVEVKSENDNLSYYQVQWHKYLSEIVKANVVIFSINKNKNQTKNLKNKYLTTPLINRINYIPSRIKICPKKREINYDDDKVIVCSVFHIYHSSKNGEMIKYNEIKKYSPKKWAELNQLTKKDKSIIITRYRSPLTHFHFKNHDDYNDYINKIITTEYDKKYNNLLKKYGNNTLIKNKTTKHQIKRNKKAKKFENEGKYTEAIKLYEKNIFEKTSSTTTYKRLNSIYWHFKYYDKIIETCDLAIQILINIPAKKNITIKFIKEKEKATNYYKNFKGSGCKFISVEQNDYIYENYWKKNFSIDSINKNKTKINKFTKQSSLYEF